MALRVGARLGPYDIEAQIGAGGMGEVYRARDTRLNREVAIKVLPDAFAHDAERLARFEREAHLLAALNHPNIAAIHELEEHSGTRYLVLEYVPGETLAEHLARGPLPVAEALADCLQIAEALEAAHEKGILHRDLKPANIKITPGGKVKVLDFGLAKVVEGDGTPDLSRSPTISVVATGAGVILGTAAYMSPEQARGRAVDKRTDIWAFGCVLYECLTGRQAFPGETVSDNIAAILEREPDWRALPHGIPGGVRHLLGRCLQKDPSQRFRDIADARLEMEEAMAPAAQSGVVPAALIAPTRLRWQVAFPWALASLLLLVSSVALWRPWREAPAPQPVKRFVITLPSGDSLASAVAPAVSISPDGIRVAYVARSGQQQPRLHLRPVDRMEATPLQETEGAMGPFFSPDGQSLGFFAGGKLKTTSVHGGPAVILCDAPNGRGGVWLPDGRIVFNPERSPTAGLMQVPARGGTPERLTTPQGGQGELNDRWPDVLPGGKALLFTTEMANERFDAASIGLQTLDGTAIRQVLVKGGFCARYAGSGHLVYARASTLLAVPFDAKRMQTTGEPVPVLQDVLTSWSTGAAHFALSRDGTLVYIPGAIYPGLGAAVWVDRKGREQPLPPARDSFFPRLSPDGRRLLVTAYEGATPELWLYDSTRGTWSRLPSVVARAAAIWSPDGRRITVRLPDNSVVSVFPDGSAREELLPPSGFRRIPQSWSLDGKLLAFDEERPGTTGRDIWLLEVQGEGSARKPGQARPFVQTRFDESQPAFSPDGHWIAYQSNESGRDEIYVRPVSGQAAWQASKAGGAGAVWSRNGREVFYSNGPTIMAVEVQMKPDFQVGRPRALSVSSPLASLDQRNYDVSPDGQRFLMIKAREAPPAAQINVVLNWTEELKHRVPSR